MNINVWRETTGVSVFKAFQRGVAVLGVALGLMAGAAQAAPVHFNFALGFTSGPLGGQTVFGSFDVADTDCVAGVCNGFFTPSGPANIAGPTGSLLGFEVIIDGYTFSANSDEIYPDAPIIELANNALASIQFSTSISSLPSLSIFGTAATGFGGSYTDANFDTSLIGALQIPEPSGWSLSLAALAACAMVRRRRA